jgi:hypothetical protein
MISVEFVVLMAKYNAWQNRSLTEAGAKPGDTDLFLLPGLD